MKHKNRKKYRKDKIFKYEAIMAAKVGINFKKRIHALLFGRIGGKVLSEKTKAEIFEMFENEAEFLVKKYPSCGPTQKYIEVILNGVKNA